MSGYDAEQAAAPLHAVKTGPMLDLVSACLDVLNNNIPGPVFLSRLAALASCASVKCAWWSQGQPATLRQESCGPPMPLPAGWVEAIDECLGTSGSCDLSLLTPDLPGAATPGNPAATLLGSPDLLVACADSSPARIILILGNRDGGFAWDDHDRALMQRVLPLIRKSIDLKKTLSSLRDRIDYDERILDEIPHAVMAMLPDGTLLSANRSAQRLLQQASWIRQQGSAIVLINPQLREEFRQQLQAIATMPEASVPEYVWYWSFDSNVDGVACAGELLAFQLSEWRIESSPSNRLAVLLIQLQDDHRLPTEKQIRELHKLTRAQSRLLVVLLQGMTLQQAAGELGVSINTVRSHLRSIYSRLGVNDKARLLQKVGATLTVRSAGGQVGSKP